MYERKSYRGVMAKVLDCDLEISDFGLHTRYHVQFRISILR